MMFFTGNDPGEPGLYLIKYAPSLRKPFCVKAAYHNGLWWSIDGTKEYPFNCPEKIVGYIDWEDLIELFDMA